MMSSNITFQPYRTATALNPYRYSRQSVTVGYAPMHAWPHVHSRTRPQELFLHCQVHPATVSLLARLPRLRRLDLRLPRGRSMDGWSCASTVVTCVLPLLLCAPSLERVHFNPEYWIVSDDEDGQGGRPADDCGLMLAAVQEGVLRLQARLRRLGRDPLMVTMKTSAVL